MTHHPPKLDPALYNELIQKSWSHWILAALFDWVIIVLTFILVSLWTSPVSCILAVIFIGSRQHGLALLGHEGTHFTIHRSRKINDALSDIVAFWPVGLTTTGYRSIHFLHHQHLNTDKDPELMHRSSKAPQWDLPITLNKIGRYILLDMIGYSVSDYFMIITGAKPDTRTTYLWMVVMHVLFITTCFYFNALWIAAIWYVALLTSFMGFFRLRTWLEHQGSDDTHRLHLHWLVAAIFSPHGAWYHHEHHALPAVPFHKMKKLRQHWKDQPAIGLRQLFQQYKDISYIRSGTPLKS